jgi:hypothetical protein
VAVARSLKEEAAPEWQDKINKLRELQEIKKGYLDEIAVIKMASADLDVRSEVGGRGGCCMGRCMGTCMQRLHGLHGSCCRRHDPHALPPPQPQRFQ